MSEQLDPRPSPDPDPWSPVPSRTRMGRCESPRPCRPQPTGARTRSSSTSGDSVIGDDEATDGPFGPRRVTYADYTASGRSLTFIEDYLRAAVLPRYANTHTESSGTGLQTIAVPRGGAPDHRDRRRRRPGPVRRHLRGVRLDRRHPQARRRARAAPARRARRAILAARPDPGRGASGRLHRPLRASLQRAAVAGVDRGRGDHPRGCGRSHRPGAPGGRARPVRRPAAADRVLLGRLERHGHPVRHPGGVGAAPSTRRAVAVGLRGRGAICGHRDGAPSVRRRMATRARRTSTRRTRSSSRSTSSSVDPARPVSWWLVATCSGTACPRWWAAAPWRMSTPDSIGYLSDPEHREEAGTPDIIGSIRAGLAFQLKEQVGEAAIAAREGVVHPAGHRALGGRAGHRHPG